MLLYDLGCRREPQNSQVQILLRTYPELRCKRRKEKGGQGRPYSYQPAVGLIPCVASQGLSAILRGCPELLAIELGSCRGLERGLRGCSVGKLRERLK